MSRKALFENRRASGFSNLFFFYSLWLLRLTNFAYTKSSKVGDSLLFSLIKQFFFPLSFLSSLSILPLSRFFFYGIFNMRYDNAHPDNLCRLSNSSHFVRKFRLNRIFISSNLIKRIDYKLYRSKVEYKDKYFSTIHSFHRKKRKSIKKYSSSSKENSSLKYSSEIWQKSAASIHRVPKRRPCFRPFFVSAS